MTQTRRRISDHFTVEEFDCKDGTHVPTGALGAVSALVYWWLEPMRVEFGQVTVHSGYRTPAYNQKVGGARQSVHLLTTQLPRRDAGSTILAAAADVSCAHGRPLEWARWAEHRRLGARHLGPRGRGGVGRYIVQGFVHLDTGPLRSWRG